MTLSHRILTSCILLIFSTTNLLSGIVGGLSLGETFAYTENDSNTFAPFQRQLIGIKQDIESEYRRNGSVSLSTLQNAKNVVQSAFDRLPDSADFVSANSEAKKGTDLNIDLAIKNPSAQTYVSNAVLSIERFANEAKIQKISGTISANPATGNAPLTVSFLASNVNDPSGVSPIPGNYIWWMRENGGYRRELGRGPTLTYTFNQEGSSQVFLDVVSGSRNNRGYTDVLPLSISQDIQIKPKLGEVTLLINGVNVSTLSKLKINPTLGKIGIILDATASRAVSNGTIKKTKWDFGNGNTLEYNGGPVIERQLYTNQGTYDVTLEIETNEGSTFKKNFQLIVVDPAAVISSEKTSGYIGEDFQLRAVTYFANTKNTEYLWTVQSADASSTKSLYSQAGQVLNYTFPKVGDYTVTLTTKSPNGGEDRDSKTITIESHEPVINLDNPRSLSTEKPNILRFDASKSYDPDTKNASNLTYRWMIDGDAVSLDNEEKDGAIGNYNFNIKGTHSVGLSVTNKYGKIATIEKSFDVTSTLAVNLNITPRAAPIGTMVNFQAIAPKAAFYEWNPGDGLPAVNGQMDSIDHIYKKTGIYSATLTVKNADGSESNSIERKIYVTYANAPFALIDMKNTSNTIIDDSTACGEGGAFVVNRSEGTTLDGSNSINIDGNPTGLTYTWKYLDQVKTGPTLFEKLGELGCFPIELTVKSDKNGATHTSKRFIQIKNIAPKITAVTTKIDQSKKDSQKLLVNVTADGARDDDGVITSYIWYYMTESDAEPQDIKITQSAITTFVLPNITEKYTFGVILEDNDGARTNSVDVIRDRSPLLITNDDGNINMPLINLTVPRTQVLAGSSVDFLVSAKTIVGSDITGKSIYQWDFNGDGKIDKKTTEARASYVYTNAGNYTAKVKVTYNGTSNSKFQNIIVKNELKAQVQGYRSNDTLYLLNTSDGFYDSTFWQIGDIQSESPYSLALSRESFEGSGTKSHILTVSALGSESSSTEITPESIVDIADTLSGGVSLQSSPKAENDTIHIHARGEKVLIALYGNIGTQFAIDTNTKIDSDLNGTPDDDLDNKDYPSFIDGSAFVIDSSDMKIHRQQVRVSIMKNGSTLHSRNIELIADFVPDEAAILNDNLSGSGSENFSDRDKINLEKLQTKIRGLKSDDRIILTQDYNSLLEDWDDTLERTKKLIDIQEEVTVSTGISDTDKVELSSLIDAILVGDASATDEITVASRVIESLIPATNMNRATIIEKLEAIKSHPTTLVENKKLGSEILAFIKDDTSIDDKYKLLIKNQLQVIISGGQSSVIDSSTPDPVVTSGGLLGFIKGTVVVFGFILGIIIVIILIGFIIYRISRKQDDMGFQDFLIDSIFHSRGASEKGTSINTQTITKNKESDISTDEILFPKIDPLESFHEEVPQATNDPMASFSQNISYHPGNQLIQNPTVPSLPNMATDITEEHTNIPEWLKGKSESIESVTTNPSMEPPPPPGELIEKLSDNTTPPIGESLDDAGIPDWLKGMNSGESLSGIDMPPLGLEESEIPDGIVSNDIENTDTLIPTTDTPTNTVSSDLPDWLIDSVGETKTLQKEITKTPRKKSSTKSKTDTVKKISDLSPEPIPITTETAVSTLSPTGDLPDWLK